MQILTTNIWYWHQKKNISVDPNCGVISSAHTRHCLDTQIVSLFKSADTTVKGKESYPGKS